MNYPRTCIIIPCYNESIRLSKTDVIMFAEKNPDFHLLLIDDCSYDNTLSVINVIANESTNKNITVLNNTINLGKAETIRNGVLQSTAIGNFQYIGYWDADLSTPLDEIHWFFTLINIYKEKKIFFGSRCHRLGSNIKRKYSRHFLGRIFATLVAKSLDLPVYDTQCGAKLFEADIAKELFAKKFYSKWFFDVELLFRYKNKYGIEQTLCDVYEVPLTRWEHREGSKLKFHDFIKAPLQLYKIRNEYKK